VHNAVCLKQGNGQKYMNFLRNRHFHPKWDDFLQYAGVIRKIFTKKNWRGYYFYDMYSSPVTIQCPVFAAKFFAYRMVPSDTSRSVPSENMLSHIILMINFMF